MMKVSTGHIPLVLFKIWISQWRLVQYHQHLSLLVLSKHYSYWYLSTSLLTCNNWSLCGKTLRINKLYFWKLYFTLSNRYILILAVQKNSVIIQYFFHFQGQSCKLLWQLGMGCPVGLVASSRIFRVNPVFFVVSRIWGVICSPFVAIFSKILQLWYLHLIWKFD